MKLEFLPYICEAFPESSGFVDEPIVSSEAGIARAKELLAATQVEDAWIVTPHGRERIVERGKLVT